MADERETEGTGGAPEQPRRSVLSELPRGRPQRASTRRETARKRSQPADGAGTTKAAAAPTPKNAPASPSRTKAHASPSPKTGADASPSATKAKASPSRKAGAKASPSPRAGAGTSRTKARTSPSRKASADASPSRKDAQRGAQPRTTAAKSGEQPQQQAPKQGYETEEQISGTPVSPPSGIEMLGSLAELAAELAHSGFAAGGRLLKGAISRISDS